VPHGQEKTKTMRNEEYRHPTLAAMVAENQQRIATYFRPYDPEKGDAEQQVTARQRVKLQDTEYWLPTAMVVRWPSLADGNLTDVARAPLAEVEEVEEDNDADSDTMASTAKSGCAIPSSPMEKMQRLRLRYDFEYWCYRCVKVQDKLSKRMIPLSLNHGQRKTAHQFEEQRLRHLPIRVIIVKARQWGGSTVTQMYMLWLQLYHYRRWHSAIVSQLKNQAINIRSMLTNVIRNYPTDVAQLSITGFEGLSSTRYLPERECKILTGSAESPDALRSFDFSMLHLSEVGLWKSTPSRSADDLVQALYSTVPYIEGSLIVMESTAKGIGTFFHKNYQAAENGESVMRPVFVGWYENENYAQFRHTQGGQKIMRNAAGLPESAVSDYRHLVEEFSPYQWKQWEQGATLEGIAWYADTKRGLQYSDYMMKSEYPGSAGEAFQTKCNRYFEQSHIEACRATCREPQFVGNISGASEKGRQALSGIHLTPGHSPSDELRIWIMPDGMNASGQGQPSTRPASISQRYLVVVDIGGLSSKADWSVISVFDRKALTRTDGYLERAATWRGHIDHDWLAWKAAQIATLYGKALLAIESNTLETKDAVQIQTSEGDHFYTVIDELSEHYSNLYMRTSEPDVAREGVTYRYGWHTNVRTKYLAYDQCRSSLRDGEYVEHDSRCVDEMGWLEKKANGSLGAITGQHDDLIDTTAIGLYLSTREMPMPRERSANGGQYHRPTGDGGYAMI
jgi:hypothetical protein